MSRILIGFYLFALFAAYGEDKQAIIDFHVHVFHRTVRGTSTVTVSETEKKVLEWYDASQMKPMGIVWLSPTYAMEDSNDYYKAIRDIISDFSDKLLNRSKVFDASGEVKHFGLCGVTLNEEVSNFRFQMNLSECRKRKFVGYKLRGFSLESDITLERFEAVLAYANSLNRIVLIHFSPQSEVQFPLNNTDVQEPSWSNFLTLVKKYKAARIVLAHSAGNSFIGLNGLAYIGNARKLSNDFKNVFIEISANPWMYVSEINNHPRRFCTSKNQTIKELSKAWKTFGAGHILYGSDLPGGDFSNDDPDRKYPIESISKGLIECPYLGLTADEKQMIYWKNAKRLLESVR